jgi:hypothetical protein
MRGLGEKHPLAGVVGTFGGSAWDELQASIQRQRGIDAGRLGLFTLGFFTLHSGEHSPYKIDCDFLTDNDIETLAYMLKRRLPVFGSVEGVPTGGLRLAEALRKYQRPVGAPLLIVDDVYTTGGSMEAHRGGREAIGAVIFARKPLTHSWVTALFSLTPEREPME